MSEASERALFFVQQPMWTSPPNNRAMRLTYVPQRKNADTAQTINWLTTEWVMTHYLTRMPCPCQGFFKKKKMMSVHVCWKTLISQKNGEKIFFVFNELNKSCGNNYTWGYGGTLHLQSEPNTSQSTAGKHKSNINHQHGMFDGVNRIIDSTQTSPDFIL